jgi:hypothetical protein
MRIGDFELAIVSEGGTGGESAEGHVPLRHGATYWLRLINHSSDTVNIYPKVDGLSVGEFQLGPHQDAKLERPADARRLFTFFASGTTEASQVGEAAVDRADKGIVAVEFVPERRRATTVLNHPRGFARGVVEGQSLSCGGTETCDLGGELTSRGFGAGVTGLTGESRQEFGHGRHIEEDRARAVTITLRLVHDPRLAAAVPGPDPLPGRRGNPVPPPVA